MVHLERPIRWLVLIMLCILSLSIGKANAGDTTESRLPSSGSLTISVSVWNDDDATLYMDSLKSGNWTFKVVGTAGLAFDCWPSDLKDPPPVYVFTYWTDTSKASDTWHYWGGGGAVCWPTSFWSTNLSSGSKYIEYKFVFKNYGDTPETVYATFTRR